MSLSSRRLRLAGMLLLIGALASCTEDLDNSAGCPILCPPRTGDIETVTIEPVTLDSTVSSLQSLGTEFSMLVANRGEALDARAIIRFDTIASTYFSSASPNPIPVTEVDSVILRIRVDTVGGRIPDILTLDLYDVNAAAPDTAVAEIAALFNPSRLLGSVSLARTELADTVRIALPPATILERLGERLRIGIQARDADVQLRLISQETGTAPTQLSYRVSPDTTIARVTATPFSLMPEGDVAARFALADYTLLVRQTALGSPTVLNVGGLPARRVYMRFQIPAFLLDSVDVVRATLLLTQIPNPSLDPTSEVKLLPFLGTGTNAVQDVQRASLITAAISSDTVRLTPGGSGVREIEVANAMTLWRLQNVADVPRVLVLINIEEGQSPLEARFHPMEAAPEFRPRLRVSYSKRKASGLP